MKKSKKIRADLLSVEQGLCRDIKEAQSYILSGKVFLGDLRIQKAGDLIDGSALLSLRGMRPFVSRGGIKLEAALENFSLDVSGKTIVDIGASTGGFTDCLLKRGAAKVFAIDVGYGQLHWSLQTDNRVVVLDRTNFRTLDFDFFTDNIDTCVADVSFISLTLLIPKFAQLLHRKSGNKFVVLLVKPQFEVEPEFVEIGGIVRDAKLHQVCLEKVSKCLSENGFIEIRNIPSPIKGHDGNSEFFITANLRQS